MPIKPTYPGVYVEEIPSGVHPIVGVSTADTAFIDFFARGPVNQATRITSYSDFERTFGGLNTLSEASYAIQQFYLNGGQIAWVVRIALEGIAKASMTLTGGSPSKKVCTVNARSEGTWATDKVQVAIDHKVLPGPGSATTFNMVVREIAIENGNTRVVSSEVYRSLSTDSTNSRYAPNIVNAASQLVSLDEYTPDVLPDATATGDIDIINAPSESYFSKRLGGGSDGDVLDAAGAILSGKGLALANALVDPAQHAGMYALDRIAPYIFNILCIPATAKFDYTKADQLGNLRSVVSGATAYCKSKRAFFIMDLPANLTTYAQITDTATAGFQLSTLDGLRDENAAIYFPHLQISDRLNGGTRTVGASGTLAGIYARTDATRGVWKAPAGTEASLVNAPISIKLTDLENGVLNQVGINVLRNFPVFGNVSWGARTLKGADLETSEWKYIPVRRTASFIEESLYEGLKWVVFEPNDEPLWSQIRLNVGAFMQDLFRQGAFQGQSRREAYFVKCDRETTTQNHIDQGIVNVVVGFAPLKPAEFVIIQLQQMAGQVQV